MDKRKNERKYESAFIPCGDALEKMDLFADGALEDSTGSESACKTEKISLKDSK